MSGPVKVARSPVLDESLVDRMGALSLGPRPQGRPPVPPPVSRTAPAVQKAYSQVDFDRENAAFEQLYTKNHQWIAVDMHFGRPVYLKADGGYVNELGVYVKAKDGIEVCADHIDHQNCLQHEGSIGFTNFAISVLNTYLRNPVRKLGQSPTDAQIAQIYQTIIGRLPSSPNELGQDDRDEMRKRVANISVHFYQKELSVLVKWMLKTRQAKNPQEAVQNLVNKRIGSLADALGCEVWRQS